MVEKFDDNLIKDYKKPTLATEYSRLKIDREPYLTKAKEAAKYTIPSLLKEDNTNVQTLRTPNQSVGADGINNLSAKVTLAMLPPNQPCFKFAIDLDDVKQQAEQNGVDADDFASSVTRGLALTEQQLVEYNEQNGDRTCLGEALKHLYVAGNVLLIHVYKSGLKFYPLNRYVVKRDYIGNILKVITIETIGFYALPEKIQEQVLEQLKIKEKTSEIKNLEKKELTLYTVYKREKKSWITYQEVEGINIPMSNGTYPLEVCPVIPLRYTRIDGEDYGRGLVEEYIGDISYLDVLSKAIKDASLAASKFIMLVNPNGQTNIKNLQKTKNGGFCSGKADDCTPLQANKYYDLQTARAEKETIERRLYRVFLLAQAVQRDSERTTATEIQYMIRELEEALGNHYSIMTKEFQLAYIKIAFYHLRKEKQNRLPDLIRDNSIKLTVTTGLEALGRSSELTKWNTFFDVMTKFAQSAQIIGAKVDAIAKMVANSLNLDIEGKLYTEEEKQQQQQQLQQQEMMKTATPNMINQMGALAQQNNAQKQMEEEQGEVSNG